MSRDLTPAESAAIQGMIKGELEPLAALLAEENESVHPIVQRFLRRLINGTAGETDFRIERRRHPDLRNGQSSAEQSEQTRIEMDTALKMVRNGALSAGMVESAIAATMEQTGLKRGAVLKHWRRQRDYMVRGLRNGTIDERILPGPMAAR